MLEWETLGIALSLILILLSWFFGVSPALPETESQGNRSPSWDSLRGLAMIGIVCIHIHSYFTYFIRESSSITQATLFLANLSRFSVPIFILSSGLFLKKKEGYWKTKVNSILIPYILASLIAYFLKSKVFSGLELFQLTLLGKVFTPYYFIPLLLQFHLIFFLLPGKFIESKFLVSLLPISGFIQLASNIGHLDFLLPSVYRSISIFNFIFFFHFGLIARSQFKNLNLGQSYASVITVVILVFCLLPISVFGIELKNHHIAYPVLFSGFLLKGMSKFSSISWLHSSLGFIGRQSMFIFLIHPFVIHTMHAWHPLYAGSFFLSYTTTLFLNIFIPLVPVLLWEWQKNN